jgi:hypothetical protein
MRGLRVGVRAESAGVLAGQGTEASAVYPPLLQSNARY